MNRWMWFAAVALVACGTEDDRRPRTVEYVTQAILAPNCGNAQCHSQFRQAENYVLDTVENARPSLVSLVGGISLDGNGEPVGSPEESLLVNVLTREIDRMPYDQSLPDPDIDLIARWIAFGAPGAQCDPNRDGGKICLGKKLHECTADFNFGAELEDCGALTCSAGACR